MQNVPWPYKPLDPNAAAQRAFEGYYKAECMYGSFEAVVGPVAEQLGSPYKDFPFLMMKYGGGGIKGWATICGTLNGAAAAIQLLSPNPDPLTNALFEWYEHEQLPNVHPKGAKFDRNPLGRKFATCHRRLRRGRRSATNMLIARSAPNAALPWPHPLPSKPSYC